MRTRPTCRRRWVRPRLRAACAAARTLSEIRLRSQDLARLPFSIFRRTSAGPSDAPGVTPSRGVFPRTRTVRGKTLLLLTGKEVTIPEPRSPSRGSNRPLPCSTDARNQVQSRAPGLSQAPQETAARTEPSGTPPSGRPLDPRELARTDKTRSPRGTPHGDDRVGAIRRPDLDSWPPTARSGQGGDASRHVPTGMRRGHAAFTDDRRSLTSPKARATRRAPRRPRKGDWRISCLKAAVPEASSTRSRAS